MRHPASQHAVWTAVLAGMLLLPAATLLLPQWNWAILPAAPGVIAAPAIVPPVATPANTIPVSRVEADGSVGTGLTDRIPDQDYPTAQRDDALVPSAPPPTNNLAHVETVLPAASTTAPWELSPKTALVWIYFTGVAGMAAYFALGSLLLVRVRAHSTPLGRRPLRVSSEVVVPVATGIVRKQVLVPTDWGEWPRPVRRAILAHEFAHLRRRDPLTMLLTRVVRCLYWFHPLAWIVSRKVSELAELACDFSVIERSQDPAHDSAWYSEVLLHFAERVNRHGHRAVISGLAMVGTSGLSRRIDQILDTTGHRLPRLRHPVMVLAAMGTPLLCLAAGVGLDRARPTLSGTKMPAASPNAELSVPAPSIALELPGSEAGPADMALELLLAQAQANPPTQDATPGIPSDLTASLRGTITDETTGEPVSKVMISFLPVTRGITVRMASSTDENGRYSAVGIPPGDYRILYMRSGYRTAYYGESSTAIQGSPLTLAAGQNLSALDIKLMKQGVITGVIRTEDGHGMPSVIVRAERERVVNGNTQLLPVGLSQPTDDRGVYRIPGLAPGPYIITATYFDQSLRYGEDGPQTFAPPFSIAYPTVHYPGVTDPSGAVPVTATAGVTVQGIDLTVRAVQATHISGRVINSAGIANGTLSVVLNPVVFSAVVAPRAAVDADGRYQLRDVLPGDYLLEAELRDGPTVLHSLRVPVTVADEPVDAPDLEIAGGVVISGTLELENAAGLELKELIIGLRPPGTFTAAALPLPATSVNAAGPFTLSKANPGRFIVQLGSLPATYYLKSARMGQVDVLESGIEVAASPLPPLQLVINGRAGAVSGTVRTSRGEPVEEATVVLVPNAQNRRALPFWFKYSSSDSTGAFNLSGIHPGEYKLFAWSSIAMGGWMDPTFLSSQDPRGEPVTIREGESPRVDLELLPGPPQ